ncbi:hypothetical protein K438DRAFT_2124157 [Mycena galopus ATCC 62051]|nr:hypothetical protein K438DRAFT_2124157 [Mycena galopus ATCC 62051]
MIAHPDPAKYTTGNTYAQTKSANILFARELAKGAEGKINVYSLNPGRILTPDGLPSKEKFTWKTLGEGAATTIAAAFDTRLDAKSGAYLVDSVEANDKIAPHSSNPENTAKLWTITQEIVGEKFTF